MQWALSGTIFHQYVKIDWSIEYNSSPTIKHFQELGGENLYSGSGSAGTGYLAGKKPENLQFFELLYFHFLDKNAQEKYLP